MRRSTAAVVCVLLVQAALFSAVADERTSAWIDLIPAIDTRQQAVTGQWQKTGDSLRVAAATGAALSLPIRPQGEYDLHVEFTRQTGVHSVAVFVVTSAGPVSFELDAWGQHLAGFQNVNGRSLQQDTNRASRVTLQNGRRYSLVVEVRDKAVRALLDGRVIEELSLRQTQLQVPMVWSMPENRRPGLGAWDANTVFHVVRARAVGAASKEGLVVGRLPEPTNSNAGTPSGSPAAPPMKRKDRKGPSKRVLIVIAHQDFYYREYADPRAELERAGILVEVAAGRRTTCRPHANSGQQGSGAVEADLALADVDPDRYDAIMFSGGWGSSMYQYGFTGSYASPVYNGDRRVKETVNRLLSQFHARDKYIGALCHGVSVLAWSRINGRSLLQGRRAVASPRKSPPGRYPGLRGQPLSRWNAEVNGARLSPVRSIGDPRTSADDVLVDGKIITGEDDNSARIFGQTLARLLTEGKTE